MRRHFGASLIRSTRPADPDAGRSPADLLAHFAESRDENAFAELVRRYGRMVLAVCRRGAGHPQDAEDAFQAVFLVLARSAGRVGRPDALGNWLYGVAVRVSGRARRAAARRARREVTAAAVPERGATPPDPVSDLRPVVERELAALPDRFRRAVELCDLDGLSRAEAAEAMGVPEGTVSSRLTTGRGLLAARLTRRGVTLGAAGLIATPTADAARLVGPTVARVVDGLATEHVRALARWGGVDMGVWARWAGVLTVAGATVGVVTAWGGRPSDDPPPPPAAKESPKVVAKEPEPAAKVPAPGRPRMTKRVEIRYGLTPVWSADGRWLAVADEYGAAVYDGETLAARGCYAAGRLPTVVGWLRDQPVLVTYKAGAGRINREEVLQFWPTPGPHDARIIERPDREPRLADAAGRPIALLDGGKAVLTQVVEERQSPGTGPRVVGVVLRVVDANTGVVVREAVRLAGCRHYEYRLSPDGKTLAVLADDNRKVQLELWDLTTGERRWEKVVVEVVSLADGRPESLYLQPPVFAPDGRTLAVSVPRPPTQVGPAPQNKKATPRLVPKFELAGAEVRLYASADGAERGKPDEQSPYLNVPVQFSHDGRLLLGQRTGVGGGDSLTIWDATSGKLLKAWDSFAPAMFAPDRPALAVLEDTSYQDGNNRVSQAVLALWDVSDLAK